MIRHVSISIGQNLRLAALGLTASDSQKDPVVFSHTHWCCEEELKTIFSGVNITSNKCIEKFKKEINEIKSHDNLITYLRRLLSRFEKIFQQEIERERNRANCPDADRPNKRRKLQN
jgi:hypothetical protein